MKCRKITNYLTKSRIDSPHKSMNDSPSIVSREVVIENNQIFNMQNESDELSLICTILDELVNNICAAESRTVLISKKVDVSRQLRNSENNKPHIPVQLVSHRKSTFSQREINNDKIDEISLPCNSTRLGIAANE